MDADRDALRQGTEVKIRLTVAPPIVGRAFESYRAGDAVEVAAGDLTIAHQ
jgi:hypothetical protein